MSVFQGDFGAYFAIVVILLVALALSFSISISGRFHNFFTFIKVSFVVVLIIIGVLLSQNPIHTSLNFGNSWEQEILLPAFATSLVFVTYAYTGWNSASYIAGEIDKPQKDIEVKDNSKVEYIFKKSLWLNNLLETLTNCSNLKEEISEILPYFRS